MEKYYTIIKKMNNLEIPKHNDCDINIRGHISYYTSDESSGISCMKI